MTIDEPVAGATPSQTIGPFFAYALTPRNYGFPELATGRVATPDAAGETIRLEGRIVDGDGAVVIDAMVEIWQADGRGRFADLQSGASNTTFTGFGRQEADPNGVFRFETVMPGSVVGPDGRPQAPHINVGIFARGLLRRLFTRIYFPDEPANESDSVLLLVPADRRQTLVARRISAQDGDHAFAFDICLQGEDETVFFGV